jgi:hypothetical protein
MISAIHLSGNLPPKSHKWPSQNCKVLPFSGASRKSSQIIQAQLQEGQITYNFPNSSLWGKIGIKSDLIYLPEDKTELLYRVTIRINPGQLFANQVNKAKYPWLLKAFSNASDRDLQRTFQTITLEYLVCPFKEHFMLQTSGGQQKNRAVLQTCFGQSSIIAKTNQPPISVYTAGSAVFEALRSNPNKLLWEALAQIRLPVMFPLDIGNAPRARISA